MSVREVLVRARKIIETPDKWCKFHYTGDNGAHCVSAALYGGAGLDNYSFLHDARVLFRRGAGTDLSIAPWNDAPERTHEEVLAAFDRAIELAG